MMMVMMLLSILVVTVMLVTSDFYLCWLSWNLGSLWLVTPRPRVNFTRLESAPWRRKHGFYGRKILAGLLEKCFGARQIYVGTHNL